MPHFFFFFFVARGFRFFSCDSPRAILRPRLAADGIAVPCGRRAAADALGGDWFAPSSMWRLPIGFVINHPEGTRQEIGGALPNPCVAKKAISILRWPAERY